MKLLRNPYVVIGLALVALVLVFRNAVAPGLKRFGLFTRQKITQAAATILPAAPVKTNAPAMQPVLEKARGIKPEVAIELSQVGWQANGSPRRDPFRGANRIGYPSALENLSLAATYRQTGGSFAVINSTIVTEGEIINGFKIENIEADLVWVRGEGGREKLQFKSDAAPTGSEAGPLPAAQTGVSARTP